MKPFQSPATSLSEGKLPLTERQQQVLNWIKAYIKLNKMPPTIQEIADGFGFYQNAAAQHVQAIEAKGWLGRVRNHGERGKFGCAVRSLRVL